MAVEPLKKDVVGDEDDFVDESLPDLVFGAGTTVPDELALDGDDDGEADPEKKSGKDTDSDHPELQRAAEAAGSEAQFGGGDAALAHEVELAIHGHFINIAQVRGVLEGLAAKGRTDYKIFKLLKVVNQSSLLDLIRKVGGKNFGDLMLEVFYGENEQDVAVIKEKGEFTKVDKNRAFYVDSAISAEIEKLFPELLSDFMKMIGNEGNGVSPSSYFNPDSSMFRKYVVEKLIFTPQILDLVDGVYADLKQYDWQNPGDDAEGDDFNRRSYRLRGSAVSEDWLDTRLAGVSPSSSYDPYDSFSAVKTVFLKDCDHIMAASRLSFGDENLWKFRLSFLLPYVEFLFHKGMSQLKRKDDLTPAEKAIVPYARYDFDDDEQLGIQVAPEIRWENHVVAVIDDAGEVSMDVSVRDFKNENLMIRVEVDVSDNIAVHYAFPPEEEPLTNAVTTHVVSSKTSYLPEHQLLAIAHLMRKKKEFFGFPLDGEFCLDGQNRLFDVQTRVAPDVFDFEHQDEDLRGYTKIAESNFTPGQKFSVKGKLITFSGSLDALSAEKLANLQAKIGDLGSYILLLNKPLAQNLSALQSLKYVHDNIFAGVIDMSRGMALTHSWVRSGASNFLRENIPAMGVGDNTDSLFDLIAEDGEDGGPLQFSVSEVEVIMICRDGKTVEVYAPNEVAGDLIRREIN